MDGMSQMVLEHYRYNISRTVLFSSEETFRSPYKDYSSLNRWQANWVSLSVFNLKILLFCNDAPTQR
jgi:hypothetical protein